MGVIPRPRTPAILGLCTGLQAQSGLAPENACPQDAGRLVPAPASGVEGQVLGRTWAPGPPCSPLSLSHSARVPTWRCGERSWTMWARTQKPGRQHALSHWPPRLAPAGTYPEPDQLLWSQLQPGSPGRGCAGTQHLIGGGGGGWGAVVGGSQQMSPGGPGKSSRGCESELG